MCLSPYIIDNPNYSADRKTGIVSMSGERYRLPLADTMKYHDLHSRRIEVPCGKCAQCASLRQGFYLQRIQMESLRSHLFFMTLTYNDEHLPHIDIGDYHLNYPDYKHIQDMFRRLRDDGIPLRYMAVSEYGKKRRPHFHCIVALDKEYYKDYSISRLEHRFYKIFRDNWKVNVSTSRKHPKYEMLYTYVNTRRGRTFDFHYIEPICNHDNDVSFYVTKYVLKYDSTTEKLLQKIKLDPMLDDLETDLLISLYKPRCVLSKDFGDWRLPQVQSHILKHVNRHHFLPQYADINTGKLMLLSPYYRKHLLPIDYIERRFNEYSLREDTFELETKIKHHEIFNDTQHKIRLIERDKKTKKYLQSKLL